MIDKFGCLGNTIKVAAGHYVDLFNPDPVSIEIESIAAALSKVCRFGGHCPKFYSVAEHSILAASLAMGSECPFDSVRAVFLHDAAEAYIGDMVKPLKVMIPQYSEAERRMESAIEKAFDVDFAKYESDIKRFDRAMLKAEKSEMWPNDTEQWAGFSEIEDSLVKLFFWEPTIAEKKFLDMAKILGISFLE